MTNVLMDPRVRGNHHGTRIKYGAGFGRPHKGMQMAVGFVTVIPAKARLGNRGIQGARDEDGFPLSRE